MSETTKRLIAGGVTLFAVIILIYGTYLPFRKSRLFITALQSTGSATSLDTFLGPFMTALDASSPIGQEELVRNFANTIDSVVRGAKAGSDETLVRALGAILDQYAEPVVERRSGLSQAQTFYAVASTYRDVDANDGAKNFRDREIALFKRGIELSPDRPQFLYGLLDYELNYGSNAQARIYAERVRELWPADENIDRVIRGLQ